MPIYEFKCESCSHIDEHLMKITDPTPEKCSICGGKVHKIMSLSSFSLKGTGWYATDYKNPAPPSSSENKESKENTENKPAETAEPVKTVDTPASEAPSSTPTKVAPTPAAPPSEPTK